jgi:nucleoside-diphosphate-sugar epimerase
MRVLVAGAHGRLGSRVVALLLDRDHHVRCFVRTESQAEALRGTGAEAVVGDLRGDVEWAMDSCDAAIFAAGARHAGELAAVDAGGAAKLAEAAARYEASRFVLCSVVGADRSSGRDEGVRRFLEAKHQAEARVARLEMPWTVLRFGALTEDPGRGRIETAPGSGTRLTLNRDDAALTVVEALSRAHLGRQVVNVLDGDRAVADALDAISPRPVPPSPDHPPRTEAALGEAQSANPPDARDMIFLDAPPLDADVDFDGDGPVVREPAGNDDPAPEIP